ncbi:hypothetical protein [Sphingobacterium spiritivorum]|uniref:hypothetical protein n=1 Tax=Sphingobacterium spiritivorum TaxID=258 RepID=UPI003DA45420
MARNTEEIYQEMLAEKQARPELAGLDSPSNTAMWQYWLRIFAQLFRWFEEKQDDFKIELQQVINDNQFGTFEWWTSKIKGFQYGDVLQFINNKFQYATEDPAKRIVHFVSVTDERGLVKIKAAKINNDRPEALNPDQAAALLSYVREIRPPGTRLAVESLPADKLKTRLRIHYNAQIGLATIKDQVEAAYVNYVNNIIFDGLYYVNRMIDSLQAIPGVIDEQVEIIELAVKQGADPYVQFSSKYQAKSGYFEVDPDFPLSTNIEYVAV